MNGGRFCASGLPVHRGPCKPRPPAPVWARRGRTTAGSRLPGRGPICAAARRKTRRAAYRYAWRYGTVGRPGQPGLRADRYAGMRPNRLCACRSSSNLTH